MALLAQDFDDYSGGLHMYANHQRRKEKVGVFKLDFNSTISFLEI
jgi:hypothetical protein